MLSYSKRRFLVSSLAASLFLSFRRSLCRAVVVFTDVLSWLPKVYVVVSEKQLKDNLRSFQNMT